MKLSLIPGYNSLFGEPEQTYEQLVADIPSDIIIRIAIMINSELTASDDEKQIRLLAIISQKFTEEQLSTLDAGVLSFRQRTDGLWEGIFFARRYLLGWMLKEMNRNAKMELVKSTADQEYRIFLAYLMVVDEINSPDASLLENAKKNPDDLFLYRLLWPGQLHQFQFNETSNFPFEVFRLLSWSKYALDHYPSYFKQYLAGIGFNAIGPFINSFIQIMQGILRERPDQILRKYHHIKPVKWLDATHLSDMSINRKMNSTSHVLLTNLKVMPLYDTSEKGFLATDYNLVTKKIYRGPLFELYRKTDLRKAELSNSYITTIAKEVIEKICFQGILNELRTNDADIIAVDDGTDGAADGYYRSGDTVAVFECKSANIPDPILENPTFDAFKEYLDSRLVANAAGKPKGIRQLANQIEKLIKCQFQIDKPFWESPKEKSITIFPVLCVDEFYFSMPGVNKYLNDQFALLVRNLQSEKIKIMPVTVVSLEHMFEMLFYGGTMEHLLKFIRQYWSILQEWETIHHQNPHDYQSIGNMMSSFGEVFGTEMASQLGDRQESSITKLSNMVNITQAELDTPL